MRAEAFEELFELHFDAIYAYLARRLGADLARDLASETFTRAFAARRRYDPQRGDVRPWLFGIANNLLRRYYRDEERRLRALARLDAREPGSPPDEPRSAEALGALSAEERDVLLLFAWADLEYAEIATVLDVPVGTVRSRLHRARAHVAPRSSERRHSMDEVALLRGFRLEDAAPTDARDYARSRLQAALARHRRRKRRGLVVLAFVGAAIVAGTAYGVVRELVIGDPAPEEVKQALARFGHEAELVPYPRPDDPRVEDARVAAILESSVGPAYLFGVPNARDLCGWVWIDGQRGYQGRPDMSGVCGRSRETFFALSRQPVEGGLVRLLSGRVSDEVERVTVRFGERTVDIPLTGRWFFAELFGDPTALVTYDAAGRVVDEHEISQGPPQGAPARSRSSW